MQLLRVRFHKARPRVQSRAEQRAACVEQDGLAVRIGLLDQQHIHILRQAGRRAAGDGHDVRMLQLAAVFFKKAGKLLLRDRIARLEELRAAVCFHVAHVDAAARLPRCLREGGTDARFLDQAAEQSAVVAAHKAHGDDRFAREGRHAGNVEPLAACRVHHFLDARHGKRAHLVHKIKFIHRGIECDSQDHGAPHSFTSMIFPCTCSG